MKKSNTVKGKSGGIKLAEAQIDGIKVQLKPGVTYAGPPPAPQPALPQNI